MKLIIILAVGQLIQFIYILLRDRAGLGFEVDMGGGPRAIIGVDGPAGLHLPAVGVYAGIVPQGAVGRAGLVLQPARVHVGQVHVPPHGPIPGPNHGRYILIVEICFTLRVFI